MRINGRTLSAVLEARGFSALTLARRADIRQESLLGSLEGQDTLSEDELTSIAHSLAVPVQTLLMNRPPSLVEAIDFRKVEPGESIYNEGTLAAFAYVERISATLADTDLDLGVAEDAVANVRALSTQAAVRLAEQWRNAWGLSIEDQAEFRDANALYVSLRSFIESKGVVVLHYSFGSNDVSGIYTRIDNGPHVIVINSTGSSKARKCFTLAHEFCHFLLRKEGISNSSVERNDTEVFCNKFAANILAPKQLVDMVVAQYYRIPSNDNDYIRLLSDRLSISQEATIRRLVDTAYVSNAEYVAWRNQWVDTIPAGDLGQRGGGGGDGVDPLQTKRTLYGTRLLGLLRDAVRNEELDEIEVFRLCGLKPRYQRQLFAA